MIIYYVLITEYDYLLRFRYEVELFNMFSQL